MGDRLLPAGPMNEAGFFQDIDFEELFDDLPEWMPSTIEHPEGHPRRDKLRQLAQSRCSLGVPWGAKFKHAPHVLPEVVEACSGDVRLVVTRRPRESSIASLNRWLGEGDLQPAEEIIDRSQAAIDRALSVVKVPVLEVDYAALLANAEQGVSAIAAFIGLPVNRTAVDFVKPALRNY
jgi:hypothetical protein